MELFAKIVNSFSAKGLISAITVEEQQKSTKKSLKKTHWKLFKHVFIADFE